MQLRDRSGKRGPLTVNLSSQRRIDFLDPSPLDLVPAAALAGTAEQLQDRALGGRADYEGGFGGAGTDIQADR